MREGPSIDEFFLLRDTDLRLLLTAYRLPFIAH